MFAKIVFIFNFGILLANPYFRNTVRLDGYQVWSVVANTETQREFIHELSHDPELEFVIVSKILGVPIRFQIPPHRVQQLQTLLTENHIPMQVEIPDVQRNIEEEQSRLLERYIKNGEAFEFDINNFNTYEDIITQLDVWRDSCHSNLVCETFSIGNTYEGREMKVLHMSIQGGEGRMGYWLDATMHGGEWLGTATLLKIIDRLITGYGSDPDSSRLLDDYDWYFLPVVNADGYSYSWTDQRTWRKSRSPNVGSSCIGTDLNRNHDMMWGNVGSSTDPCSNSFRGSAAADQLETQAMQNTLDSLGPSLLAMVSIHTSGNMWLTPWGWVDGNQQCAFPVDYDEIMIVANAIADATQATHGTTWTRGSICSTIYPAAGGTIDYTKGVSNIKYTFTPELRSMGTPAEASIQPSFEEVWNGVVAMVDTIAVVEAL